MSLQMALVHPYLWLSSIPLCVHLIFLIRSPVDGPFCKQCALQHSNSVGIQPQEDRAISTVTYEEEWKGTNRNCPYQHG